MSKLFSVKNNTGWACHYRITTVLECTLGSADSAQEIRDLASEKGLRVVLIYCNVQQIHRVCPKRFSNSQQLPVSSIKGVKASFTATDGRGIFPDDRSKTRVNEIMLDLVAGCTGDAVWWGPGRADVRRILPVSYTHLTLPTKA